MSASTPEAVTPAAAEVHTTSIHHEGPTRSGAFAFGGGHRARCTCGWRSDCYSQLSDTERAIEVHLRRARRQDFEGLIARSSIGRALADVKARGIEAHLIDLEHEMNRRRTTKKKRAKKMLSAEDAAFMRGFGLALATIWRCHHDGQMARDLIKQNNFTLADFRDIDMLDADYETICHAVEPRKS